MMMTDRGRRELRERWVKREGNYYYTLEFVSVNGPL